MYQLRKSTIGWLLIAALTALLSACGGSGGSDTPPPDGPSVMPPPPDPGTGPTPTPPDPGTGPMPAPNLIPVAMPEMISRDYPSDQAPPFPSILIDLFAIDSDGSIDSYRITMQPTHAQRLTLSGPGGNQVIFEPRASFTDVDQFEFVAIDNDGATSPPARVTIMFRLIPVPVAIAQDITIQPQASVTIVLAGVDVGGTIASYKISEQPNQGTLIPNPSSSNTWEYTQDSDFTGTDTFSFTVTDNDGIESAPAIVMVGQPRLTREMPDFRSFEGYASATPQVRVINYDLYADVIDSSDLVTLCPPVPVDSSVFECHGDRTTRTFINNLGPPSDIYHYSRLSSLASYSINGRENNNSNITTIIAALETVGRDIISWSAVDTVGPRSLGGVLMFGGQEFERSLVEGAAYIAEQNAFMVISIENTTTSELLGVGKDLTRGPLFCDDLPGLCSAVVDFIIKGERELTDKLKSKSVFAGAIRTRIVSSGGAIMEATGAAKEGGEIEANAIYVPLSGEPRTITTSHAAAKLGAVAAKVSAALRSASGQVPTAEEIKAGLLARTEMLEVDYAEGAVDRRGTRDTRKRTVRVLTNERFPLNP